MADIKTKQSKKGTIRTIDRKHQPSAQEKSSCVLSASGAKAVLLFASKRQSCKTYKNDEDAKGHRS